MYTEEIRGELLENEKEHKLLLRFSLPILAGMLAGSVYDIINRLFIGNSVGSDALAAIAAVFPTMLFVLTLSFVVGIGASSGIAIARGSGLNRHAERILNNGILLLLFFGCIAMFVGLFFADNIVQLAGVPKELHVSATSYLRILLLAGPFFIFSSGISNFIKACGSPKYAMTTQLINVVLNVLADLLFILFLHLGLVGAAWGTVLAKSISSLWALRFFLLPNSPLRLRRIFLLNPNFSVMKKIISVGASTCIVHFSIVLFMIVINKALYKYGGDTGLAVMGIFLSLDTLLYLPAMAFGDAAQTIIGYNYGARRPERVLRTIKAALMYNTTFYIFVTVMVEIFTEYMVSIFNPSDHNLIEMGVLAMRIGYAGSLFVGVSQITSFALQALAKVKEALILALLRNVMVLLGLALLLPPIFGLTGVWMVYPISDTIGSIISSFFLFRIVKYMKSPKALKVAN